MDDATRYSASPDCEVAPFGDGVAILDLRSNTYFSMNASGRIAFEALRQPLTRGEVVARVAAHYGIEPAACDADVARLLDDLAAHRLVERS
jgi:hypothetical protein